MLFGPAAQTTPSTSVKMCGLVRQVREARKNPALSFKKTIKTIKTIKTEGRRGQSPRV
jgi:hypothetical protein